MGLFPISVDKATHSMAFCFMQMQIRMIYCGSAWNKYIQSNIKLWVFILIYVYISWECLIKNGAVYPKNNVQLWCFLPEANFGLWVLSSPASVCLSVCLCVCINHLLVRTITHQPFKLESPNLDQRCKTPWLRCLLFIILGGDRPWHSR